jgi:IS5 family transposase
VREPGLFDLQMRMDQLRECGHPLERLDKHVDWEAFRPQLQSIRDKDRKSPAGRKPYDVVLMFKILILQSLYNLSDAQTEFQIKDRLSFMHFLGLSLGDRVPDEKTVWLFREQLTGAGLIKPLFEQFEAVLAGAGFAARAGQIVDASIVPAPRQRNSREENQQIKAGDVPESWDAQPAKKRQKDTDARWTKKHGTSYYGYKNHVSVDVKHKFIRRYAITDAAVHDSQALGEVLDETNTNGNVYGDSAYRSAATSSWLNGNGYRDRTHYKGHRSKPLTKRQQATNRRRSPTRARVEHVFGVQSRMARDLIIRTIGIVRAEAKIGLRNLAYNLNRYSRLLAPG